MQIHHHEDPSTAAARALSKKLAYVSHRPIHLLLSGGSSDTIYHALVQNDLLPRDCSALTIGLIDERWGHVSHEKSNMKRVIETGLADVISKRGGSIRWILGVSDTPDASAVSYDQWLHDAPKKTQILAVLGIGSDGHTAGMLPLRETPDMYRRLFHDTAYAVYYENEHTTHKKRITVTATYIAQIDWFCGVLLGESKQPVIRAFRTNTFPQEHVFPSQVLSEKDGVFYTDQHISKG